MNELKFSLAALAFMLVAYVSVAAVQRVSLESSNPVVVWEVCPQDDVKEGGKEISTPGFSLSGVKGVVPGTVFTAYVEAGKEPDPNFGDNIYKVDETFYNRPFWYRTQFEIPATYVPGQRVWLCFDGTNRFADFYFNGHKLSGVPGSTKDVSGHMMRTKYDVTDLVKTQGGNAVAVLITDPDQKKTRTSEEGFGVTSSPTYLAAAGWDWMPYVPGRLAGITGKAYIEFTGDLAMRDTWVRSDLPSNDTALISVSTVLYNTSDADKKVTLDGVVQPGNIHFSKNVVVDAGDSVVVSLDASEFPQLVVADPKLWWPNGYGDPNLYTCTLECRVDGKLSDVNKVDFGVRKYEYEMIDNVVGWPVLTLYINGQKLFLKGGNWGMSEYLLRCRGDEYETKIRLHKDLNYNMIRLWTGCVTDDEFYDWCDRYGIMVWDDFWLYVAYNDVAQPEAFKANALDKVKRLRNHPSIAVWCGANETHPKPELDNYLREMIAREDNGDRLYKSCSNQDGLSGSGWWGNQPPKHHFENSGSNLAWNKPPYPYGIDRGYGLRTEIGTATFPVYESVTQFIPKDKLWPLPTDEQLKEQDDNVWNKHFFGKDASNANPVNYKKAVNTQYGESSGLEEFCEKAQLLNIEVMKGMYEAWNDKMWNDASGILIWMSQSAYPSFVWQTYDYYYDAGGAYWGAKKACEPLHIQWNCSNNSIKIVNTTSKKLKGAVATAQVYGVDGKVLPEYACESVVDVEASNVAEAFVINFNPFNLANGKQSEASTSTQNRSSGAAVDGGAGSRWESEYKDEQWISIDLGRKERIETVVIKWEAAFAKEYRVQLSNDARQWTTVFATNEGRGGTEEIAFKPVAARYIRVLCDKRATGFGFSIYEIEIYAPGLRGNSGDNGFVQDLSSPMQFLRLELKDASGELISDNFYWRNAVEDGDFTLLKGLPEALLSFELVTKRVEGGRAVMEVDVANRSGVIAFADRLRLVDAKSGQRVLPVIMSDNYFTLMPGERTTVSFEVDAALIGSGIELLSKQYGKQEKKVLDVLF